MMVPGSSEAVDSRPGTPSLHTTVLLALALGVLLSVLAMVILILTHWQERRAADERIGSITVAGLLLDAAREIALERGLTQTALLEEASAAQPVRDVLHQQRVKADAAFLRSVDLTQMAVGSPGYGVRIARLRDSHREIVQLRQMVDAQLTLANDRRDARSIDKWLPKITAFIMQVHEANETIAYAASGNESLLGLLRMRDAAWRMSEYAGRERALIGGLIAQGLKPDEPTLRRLLNYEGQVYGYWETLQAGARDATALGSLRLAVAGAQRRFIEDFQLRRAAIYHAIEMGTPYPVSAYEWFSQSTEAIDALWTVERATAQAISEHLNASGRLNTITFSLNTSLILMPALILIGLGYLSFITFIKPLKVLGETLLQLARGIEKTEIPFAHRQDEVGALARAISAFKQSRIERRQLEEEVRLRREIEASLEEEKLKAEMSNRAKSVFLSHMSHELRTPLNAIIGFSDILRSQSFGDLGNPRYVEYAGYIGDSGHHLLGIINDLLELSRIDNNDFTLSSQKVAATDIITFCARAVSEGGNAGRVLLLGDGGGVIDGDPRLLRQVLMNLLSNALKYSPHESSVTVEAVTDTAGRFGFQVVDQGEGIPEDKLEAVMQPFLQLDDRGLANHGLGLGLFLANRFMELHGGHVELVSASGRGTMATAWLPAERVVSAQNKTEE